jgi:RNA polymerase sigma-54 factor
MALGPRLDLRQSQSLVMTPQLQQAIRLLALSNLEIETFIAEELEKNPLLDTVAGDPDFSDRDDPSEKSEILDLGSVETDAMIDGDGRAHEALDVDLNTETFHHDSLSDSSLGLDGGLGMGGTGNGAMDDGPDFEAMEADAPSLHDHLAAQAGMLLSGMDMVIGRHLIDHVDEAGYLRLNLVEASNQLGVPLAVVETVLAQIQSLDPTGVGARSLSECLALQAREADRYDPAMARLIDNLDLLAQGRIAQLQRICGVDGEDMSDMIRELRAMDPKPGLRFGFDRVQAVTPDVFVAARGKGWAVEINTASLPRVLVNQSYYVELSTGSRESKAWLNECLASANWLVKAMDQRQRTIIKVASEIVKHQDAFFRQGVAHLRPLTLRQVAEATGLHESTISRVTSNKYMACARGIFELKFFFTSGVAASDGGEAVSAEAVKSAIRSLINTEAADAILSDDTLVEMLKEHGFDLARRTVAKYREAIGIGSSVQRRRARVIQSRAA